MASGASRFVTTGRSSKGSSTGTAPARWRDVPAEFGPWQTVWKRHRRLAGDGTWDKVRAALLSRGRRGREAGLAAQRGLHGQPGPPARHEPDPSRARHRGHSRITRICWPSPLTTPSAAPVAGCRPRSTSSSTPAGCRWWSSSAPGRAGTHRCSQRCSSSCGSPVGPGRPRSTPAALLGRQGVLLARHPRDAARPRDHRRHRRTGRPGRPPQTPRVQGRQATAFDAHRYKDRNVVERSYNAIKQWRALATRYDKLAITYRAGLLIRAVVMWLQALGDTP